MRRKGTPSELVTWERLCPHRVIVRVEGDLTPADAVNEFTRMVRASFSRPRTRKMLLDLRKVRKADSKLVAALVAMNRTAQHRAIDLIIRPSHLLRHWIMLYRVDRLLRSRRSARPTPSGQYRCCRSE